MTYLKNHSQLIILTVLIFVLWNTAVIWPLRVLVVFFHELSHGGAALVTGGSIDSISISRNEGGVVWTRGGSSFAISSAGYLGSLVIGLILFIGAVRSDFDRWIAGGFGVLVLITAALYMRDGFAVIFACGFGITMIASAILLPQDLTDLILRIIGLTSMIYAPYDILDDTIFRNLPDSDAGNMAKAFGGTGLFWGWVWVATSLVLILLCLRFGIGAKSNIDLSRVTARFTK